MTRQELGHFQDSKFKVTPLPQEGGVRGVPPRAPSGTGELGNGGDEQPGDAELFWALHNRSVEEMPGLDEILARHGLPADSYRSGVSNPRVERFLDEAWEQGLIKNRPGLTLRQYIGAILPI